MLLGQHCSMLSTILFGIVTPDFELFQHKQYILFNIVDNQEQSCPHNIVTSCFQQPVTTHNFLPCKKVFHYLNLYKGKFDV